MILLLCPKSKATVAASAGVIHLASILVAKVKADRGGGTIGSVICSSFWMNWIALGANEVAA